MSPRRRHRVHRQYLRQLLSPAFALAAVALLEVLSWTPWSFAVPTTILLTAVVASTFVGGLVDGLISAGITAWYYSYLLSSPGMVFPYSHEALRRVLVFACSAPAVALMVGVIKQRAARVAAEAKRKERESSDAVFASLTWTRDAQKTGREAERRYRALFDASVMGILRGFRDGRPVECNEAFVRLLGYGDRADVMARNTRDFFAASADFERVLERLDSGGLSIEEELGFRRKDGEIRRMRLSARRLEEGAGLVIELGVVDVTPQHQAEARAAALEARMVAHEGEVAALRLEADALAQAMAHDLRAPVRRIDDLSQSLLVDYGLALDGDGRARLNRLEATNRGVEQLLQRFVEISRATAAEPTRERVDLSAMVHAIAQEFRGWEPDRSVAFMIAQGITATGDPALLRLALTRLIATAWSATTGQPAPRIEFGAVRVGDRRAYVVSDDGTAFERPYTGALPGAIRCLRGGDDMAGVGVGLVMVQRIIQRHAGRAWVEATPEGAAFFFSLGERPPSPPASA